jgi:hypothetical protein
MNGSQIAWVLFLSLISPWAAQAADTDETVSKIESCYKGLAPSLGIEGTTMKVAGAVDNAVIAASGRRGKPEKLGVYVFYGGKISFFEMPTANPRSSKILPGGRAENFYVKFDVGEGEKKKTINVVFRNEAFRPMRVASVGATRDLDKDSQPLVHAEVTGQNIPLNDEKAKAAFTETLAQVITDRVTNGGGFSDGDGRAAAVTGCLANFNRDTTIGAAITSANRRFAAAGPRHKAGDDALVFAPLDESQGTNRGVHF